MSTQEQELRSSDWLKIITNKFITAEQIALVEGCNIKTARKMVQTLTPNRLKGTPYVALTDSYLKKYRGTDRASELRIIYGRD